MSTRDYFDFDEIDNAIDNLEMVAHFLNSTFAFKWKWVCIALYQSLYGLAIAALGGNDPRQTVYDKSRNEGKAIALHANGIPDSVIASCFGVSEKQVGKWLASPWLISFDEALCRVQKQANLPPYDNVKPLTLSDSEKRSIKKVSKEFRNEFEHFSPKRWAIDLSGSSKIVKDVLRVICFIALDSNCLTMSNTQEEKLKAALLKIKGIIGR
jgi:hypothetical protein